MVVGEKYQWNKYYRADEIVTVLKLCNDHALVVFPSGAKIATKVYGLWPITKKFYDTPSDK